jgi:hypothetical protein
MQAILEHYPLSRCFWKQLLLGRLHRHTEQAEYLSRLLNTAMNGLVFYQYV